MVGPFLRRCVVRISLRPPALRRRSFPTRIQIPSSSCSTLGNSSGAATPTEQLVGVSSELVDGLAAALILGHLGR